MDSVLSGLVFASTAALARHLTKQKQKQKQIKHESSGKTSGSGCPFGFSSSGNNSNNRSSSASSCSFSLLDLESKMKNALKRSYRPGHYENYINLPILSRTWNDSSSNADGIEPYLTSSLQGVELGLLLLAEFIKDAGSYLIMRPRIELICRDIIFQVCIYHLIQL